MTVREGRFTEVSVYRVVTFHYIIEVEVFMQNDFDLSHINRQIQKNTADIVAARRQAQNQRAVADQHNREGDHSAAAYYEKEATRFDHEADQLENANDQLQAAQQRTEQRIADLERQRAQVSPDHASRLAQLDKELAQLRGSGMML